MAWLPAPACTRLPHTASGLLSLRSPPCSPVLPRSHGCLQPSGALLRAEIFAEDGCCQLAHGWVSWSEGAWQARWLPGVGRARPPPSGRQQPPASTKRAHTVNSFLSSAQIGKD